MGEQDSERRAHLVRGVAREALNCREGLAQSFEQDVERVDQRCKFLRYPCVRQRIHPGGARCRSLFDAAAQSREGRKATTDGDPYHEPRSARSASLPEGRERAAGCASAVGGAFVVSATSTTTGSAAP